MRLLFIQPYQFMRYFFYFAISHELTSFLPFFYRSWAQNSIHQSCQIGFSC